MDLRYPIGPLHSPTSLTVLERADAIARIAAAPQALRSAVDGLSPEQLDTPYREGGWTVRQVVHHVPDSHLNAYVRFKRALTEDEPAVPGYDQDGWAGLPDSDETPVAVSLALMDALHARWVLLLGAMDEGQYGRTFVHSEIGVMKLFQLLALYAWHGDHHVAHVTGLRQRMGW